MSHLLLSSRNNDYDIDTYEGAYGYLTEIFFVTLNKNNKPVNNVYL